MEVKKFDVERLSHDRLLLRLITNQDFYLNIGTPAVEVAVTREVRSYNHTGMVLGGAIIIMRLVPCVFYIGGILLMGASMLQEATPLLYFCMGGALHLAVDKSSKWMTQGFEQDIHTALTTKYKAVPCTVHITRTPK